LDVEQINSSIQGSANIKAARQGALSKRLTESAIELGKTNGAVNEIILKIEMKKFQNLITDRMMQKNNLINKDNLRVYPMNKVVDGTAKFAEAPCDFNEGLLKFKPKLFKFYEKKNK
jgi:hypothetical protein